MLCGKVSGNAQQNMRTEAGEPRMRIAFALDGGNQLLAGGGGLRGTQKAVFQPFIHADDIAQRSGVHRAQAVEKHLRERVLGMEFAAPLGREQLFRKGNGRTCGLNVAHCERGAHAGCAGKRGRRTVVIAASLAENGHGGYAVGQGLKIFQRKRGIGKGNLLG